MSDIEPTPEEVVAAVKQVRKEMAEERAEMSVKQDTTAEVVEKPEPKPAKPARPKTHVMREGENIMTVAMRYLPAGMTRQEYLRDLVARNRNLGAGATIRL